MSDQRDRDESAEPTEAKQGAPQARQRVLQVMRSVQLPEFPHEFVTDAAGHA